MSEIDRLRRENLSLQRANKSLHQANRNHLWHEEHTASRLKAPEHEVSMLQSEFRELRELLGPEELCAIPQPARMRISEIVFGKTEMNSVNLDDARTVLETARSTGERGASDSVCDECGELLQLLRQLAGFGELWVNEIERLQQALDIARHEAATHELVKREALATVQQLEQQVVRQRDAIEQLKDRAEIVRDQLNSADSRAKAAVQQEMAECRAARGRAESELDDVLRSLAELVECDMQEFSELAASGNHQLRRVVLLTQQIIRLQKLANDRVAAGRADASEVPS